MKLCMLLQGLLVVLLSGLSSQNVVPYNSFYQFSSNLYKHVISSVDKESNVVLSPASIQACLTFAYMAASGSTAAEMSTVLALDKYESRNAVAESYRGFFEDLDKKPEVVMANRMYVANGLQVKPTFNETATRTFRAGVESVDFSKEETMKIINDWVEQQTHHNIKNLVTPGLLEGNTVAALVNAIYFKAKWVHPFKGTDPLPFNVKPNSMKLVPTMSNYEISLSYTTLSGFNADAMEFPYKNSNLKMYIILPNMDGGLEKIEETFSMDLLKAQSWTHGPVDVRLPKFKFEAKTGLKPILIDMGMEKAFHGGNFDGLLVLAEPIEIDDVIHKAKIAVDELGTEASAATLVAFASYSMGPTPKYFHVNRPFMFVISDDTAVYFQGRVVDPSI